MLVLWLMCSQTLRRVFRPAWRSSCDVLPLTEPRRQLLRCEAQACERWYTMRYVLLPDPYSKNMQKSSNGAAAQVRHPSTYIYMVQHHCSDSDTQ